MFQEAKDPGRDAAFNNPHVESIARELLTARHRALVRFAKIAILSDATGKEVVLLGEQASRDPALVQAARRIAMAGREISKMRIGEASNVRGAVVERIVYEFVRSREPTTLREHRVKLGNRKWSHPKEVVTNADPVEVYECKRLPRRFNQADIDELHEIGLAVRNMGRGCLPAIVAMEPRGALKRALEGLTLGADVYWVAEDEIIELGDAPPSRLLRSL